MQGKYQVTAVPPDLMIHRLSGFFDVRMIQDLARDVGAAFRKLRCGPNEHVSLINVSECALQSQDAFAAFQELLARPEWKGRRVGFVLANPLARMQVRRLIADRPEAEMFETEEAALAWIRTAPPRAAA